MAETSSYIFEIGVESSGVKSSLTALRKDFVSATKGIQSSLKDIEAFKDLKADAKALSATYATVQAKVKSLAKEMKSGGTAELSKEFEAAKKSAAKLKGQLSENNTSLQAMRTKMAAAGISTKNLSADQLKLKGSLSEAKQEYAAMSKVANAQSVLKIPSTKNVTAEITAAKTAYADLRASNQLTVTELATAKVAMVRQISAVRAQTTGWKDDLIAAKFEIAKLAVASLAIGKSIQLGISFESSMADVSKTVGGTKEEITALGDQIQKLSTQIPVIPEELAKIAAAGGQLGIPLDEILQFTALTAKMGTAFDMTAEEAGDSIGKIKNVFNLTIGEVEGFGDAINTLGNNTAARERDIVAGMLRIGGTSEQFGLAKEQAAALVATMIGLGKAPEVAATAINSLLNKMQTANVQNKNFKQGLLEIGTSAEEMAAMVADKPQEAVSYLLESLGKLEGQHRAEVLTALFGTEFNDDIATLVGGLDSYNAALAHVADTTAIAGSMSAEFEKKVDTTESQLSLLKNTLVDIQRSIGEGFSPTIKALAETLNSHLSPVVDLVREFPELAAGITTFAIAAVSIGALKTIIPLLLSGMLALGKASLAFALTPMGALIAGLALVAASYVTIKKAIEEVEKADAELAANQKYVNDLTDKAVLKFVKIGVQTGVNINSMEDWKAAVKDGTIVFDKETGQWTNAMTGAAAAASEAWTTSKNKIIDGATSSGAKQVQISKDTLDKMKAQYQAYATEIQRLQDDIANREMSLADKLRAMDQSVMSDSSAWDDKKKQAEEYAAAAVSAETAAKAAIASGDLTAGTNLGKEALQYYDKAAAAAAELNRDVKDSNNEVISSQQQNEAVARALVEEYGNAAIELQKSVAAAVTENANALNEASGGQLAKDLPEIAKLFVTTAEQADKLKEKAGEFEKNWASSFSEVESDGTKAIDKLSTSLDTLVKKRTVEIQYNMTEGHSAGGAVGGLHLAEGGAIMRNLLGGGSLPGFGGGDRRHAVLEDGEVVINKNSVQKVGTDTALAFNSGNFGVVIRNLLKKVGPSFHMATGGVVSAAQNFSMPALPSIPAAAPMSMGPGDTYNLSVNFSGEVSSASQTTARQQAKMILSEFKAMNKRRS